MFQFENKHYEPILKNVTIKNSSYKKASIKALNDFIEVIKNLDTQEVNFIIALRKSGINKYRNIIQAFNAYKRKEETLKNLLYEIAFDTVNENELKVGI